MRKHEKEEWEEPLARELFWRPPNLLLLPKGKKDHPTLASKAKPENQSSNLGRVPTEFVTAVVGKWPKRAPPELCRTCKPPSFQSLSDRPKPLKDNPPPPIDHHCLWLQTQIKPRHIKLHMLPKNEDKVPAKISDTRDFPSPPPHCGTTTDTLWYHHRPSHHR